MSAGAGADPVPKTSPAVAVSSSVPARTARLTSVRHAACGMDGRGIGGVEVRAADACTERGMRQPVHASRSPDRVSRRELIDRLIESQYRHTNATFFYYNGDLLNSTF